jgi:hypothetical protein
MLLDPVDMVDCFGGVSAGYFRQGCDYRLPLIGGNPSASGQGLGGDDMPGSGV